MCKCMFCYGDLCFTAIPCSIVDSFSQGIRMKSFLRRSSSPCKSVWITGGILLDLWQRSRIYHYVLMYMVKICFLLIDVLIVKFTTNRRFQVFLPLDFSFFLSSLFFPALFSRLHILDQRFASMEECPHECTKRKEKCPGKKETEKEGFHNTSYWPRATPTLNRHQEYSMFSLLFYTQMTKLTENLYQK